MALQKQGDLKRIARETEDYTGADLKAVLYSAQLSAAHRALEEQRKDSKTAAISSSSDVRSEDAVGGEPVSTATKVMVYKLTSSAECTELQAKPDLQRRVCITTLILQLKFRTYSLPSC